MSNEVYANGREVSCKAAAGKSICAFPDVCMTPPQTPATPPGVPIPYPNTGMASDCTDGSKNVKISGEEVLLKDKSYFKKSMGDEAGCAPMKGLISHKIQGKIYFTSWSPDVKFEGENVVRTLDLTTHNHGSNPNEAIPWPYADKAAVSPGGACEKEGEKVTDNCSAPPEDDQSAKCCEARKCMLIPYSPNKCCKKNGKKMTPHHLVPSADFVPHKVRSKAAKPGKYNSNKAPCICAEGKDHNARKGRLKYLMEHGRIGRAFSRLRRAFLKKGGNYNVENACKLGAKSGKVIAWECSERCLEHQLKEGHKGMGQNPSDPMPRVSRQNAPQLFKIKMK